MKSLRSLPILWVVLLAITAVTDETVAGDIDNFGFVKGALYVQAGPGAPTAAPGSNQVANAFLSACSWQGVKSSRLILPGGSSQPLAPDQLGSTYWSLEAEFLNSGARDSAYPDGAYKLVIETSAEGTITDNLTVNVASDPPAPHVANYVALQAANSASALLVQWDPISGGTVDDFVQVEIHDGQENTVFSSPDVGNSRALTGTNASIVLPGGLLRPGETYSATLTIGRGSWYRSSQPGAVGIAGYFKQTQFPIRTVDADFYLAVKGRFHVQTSSAAPTPAPEWMFHLEVKPASTVGPASFVTNASVQLPGGGNQILDPLQDYSFDATYPSDTGLDSAHPNGAYAFTIKTVHDETVTAAVNLAGNTYPPSAPRIANFDAAQAIRADTDFILSWDPLGGTGSDVVLVQIDDALTEDSAIASPGPGHRGTLNGTSTAFVIPAGTLTPGRSYQARIIWARGEENTTSYPGVAGFAGCFYGTMTSLRAGDVGMLGIVKAEQFEQLSGGNPVFKSFHFEAFVENSSSAVTNSALRLPGGSVQTLNRETDSHYLEYSFDTRNALDAAFPNGTYTNTLGIQLAGLKPVALPMPADNYPAGAARVSNLAAAQIIDSCRDFTLSWELPVAGENDYVQVMISDQSGNQEFFFTPVPGQLGALNGTNTSVMIPANTLRPGRNYNASLLIARGSFDTAAYPGTLVLAVFACETRFPLATSGTIIRPIITGFQFQGTVDHMIFGRCEPGLELVLERSSTLQPGSFVPVSTNWSAGENFSLFSNLLDPQKQFYRVREK